MMLWQQVVKAAILGSERQTFSPLSFCETNQGDQLHALLSKLDSRNPEDKLLSLSAILPIYQRAGQYLPMHVAPLPEPCEMDDMPCCNAKVAWYLSRLMNGEYGEVLSEWLELARQMGRRVPEEYLPQLLNRGKDDIAIREAMEPVIGKRGYWLAQYHTDWSYLWSFDGQEETIWQTGKTDMRLALLRRLRVHHPARARALVATTWNVDSAQERKSFLELFIHGLSKDDEPFLEQALDDRSKDVQQAASEILTRLPNSALVQRMIERLDPLIRYQQKDLRKPKINVILPKECDNAMSRDGVGNMRTSSLSMREIRWFHDMLISVPLSHWLQKWKISHSELIEAATHSRWKDTLLNAFTEAAYRHCDAEIAELFIIKTFPERMSRETMQKLFHMLSPKQREQVVRDWIQKKDGIQLWRNNTEGMSLLLCCDHRWSAEFTIIVMRNLYQYMTERRHHYPSLEHQTTLRTLVRFMNPFTLDEITSNMPVQSKSWSEWQNIIHEVISFLEFRRDMVRQWNMCA